MPETSPVSDGPSREYLPFTSVPVPLTDFPERLGIDDPHAAEKTVTVKVGICADCGSLVPGTAVWTHERWHAEVGGGGQAGEQR